MRQFIAACLRSIAQRLDPKLTPPVSRLISPGDALIQTILQFQQTDEIVHHLAIVITGESYHLLAVDPNWQDNQPRTLQVTGVDTIDDINFLPLSVSCATEAIQKLPTDSGPLASFPEPEPGSFWAANITLLHLIKTALTIALQYGTPCTFIKGYRTYRDTYLGISANPSNGAVFVVAFISGMGGSDRVLDLTEANVLESYIPHLQPDGYEGGWEDRIIELSNLLRQQEQAAAASLELSLP